MLAAPIPGNTYKWTFSKLFSALDGVYTLVKYMTYDEYLSDGGDIQEDLFAPQGYDSSTLDIYLDDIRSGKMMKLVTPITTGSSQVTVYMPTVFAEENPNYRVNKYMKLGIVSYIGVTEDAALLEHMKTLITEYVLASTGIDPDPRFVSVGEVWLTDEEYEEVLAERDSTAQKTVNYYSENIKLEARIASLQSRLEAYEEIIIQLHKRIENLTSTSGG